jgi:type I restriction enzyme S subunit
MIDFNDLPPNWSVRRFDDVLAIRKGNLDPALMPDEEFDLFSIPAFDESRRPEHKRGREIGSSKVVIRPDDCLFSKLNPRIPRTWVVPATNGRRQIASTEFWPLHSRFKPDEEGYLAPELLQWLFRCAEFLDGFRGEVSGGVQSRQRLQQDAIRDVQIPVPPLAEQRRLVARIEALTSRLEQARQARQAALAEAELIMQSHRCRLLEDYGEENLTRFGELVAGTQLGLVRSKEQQSEAHPWPYLKMNNITTAGTLDLSKVTSVEASDDEAEKFRLADGDFLFNTRNSYELVGKTAVWSDNGEPVLYNNNIMRIRFRPGIESRFVNAVFLTPAVQSQLDGFKKQTTSVCAIYWKNLKDIEIPLPPLPEQKRIADSLDALAAKQTDLRRLQTETEAELAAFTPALLAKAFRGEL